MKHSPGVTLAAIAFLVAACGNGQSVTTSPAQTSGSTQQAAVTIVDFAFDPADITVAAGTTVTWTNTEDGIAHTTTSDDDVWSSGTLNSGDTFSHTFDQPGTFTYACTIHPIMKASITVEG